MTWQPAILLALLLFSRSSLLAQQTEALALDFDDSPLDSPVEYPSWFKKSFLHLPDELKAANQKGKRGLILYFGQSRCAYCKQLIEVNFAQNDIANYTQRHFELIPIDIHGIETVTDLQGVPIVERDFAIRENANFTPTLIFYNQQGEQALVLRGYYPPYKFRAALEYVADGHYRQGSFPDYLERGSNVLTFEIGDLNDEAFFSAPPHNLDRSKRPGERPLVVFFEQRNCHACDILHAQPLQEPVVRKALQQTDSLQLDINSDMPIITPAGEKTSAKGWAESLGLFYSPALLFFDRQGKEIIRLDSVAHFHRLETLLHYILEDIYQQEPNYLRWRLGAPM